MVTNAHVVKEPTHVKGGYVGLGRQNDVVVGREIGNGDYPQDDPRDGPEPLRHGALVAEGIPDASREGFRHPQNPVDGKGHALANPKGPFDGVCGGGIGCHFGRLTVVLVTSLELNSDGSNIVVFGRAVRNAVLK